MEARKLLRSLRSRIERSSEREGSALLMVMIFAAIMAVMMPVMMNFYKFNSQSTAFNRDIVVKNLSYASLENYTISPITLMKSFDKSTYKNSSPPVNTCFATCMGKNSSVGANSAAILAAGGDLTDSCNTPDYSITGSGFSCVSRDASFATVWHQITLFHPVSELPISGPDSSPSAGSGAAQFSITTMSTPVPSRRPVRYTLDGQLCDGTTPEKLCPFEAMTWFHPICPGDEELTYYSPQVSQNTPPESLLKVADKAKSDDKGGGSMWFSQLIKPFDPIPEAEAKPPNQCVQICFAIAKTDPSQSCSGTPPSGWVQCANDPCFYYDPSNAGSNQYCCNGVGNGCGSTVVLTSTNTNGQSGMYTGTGTSTSTNGPGTSNTHTYIQTCTRAAAFVLWYKISWNTQAPWNTNRRLAGFRDLNSRVNIDGTWKDTSQMFMTKRCGEIFPSSIGTSTDISPHPHTGPSPHVGPPAGCP